MLQRQELTEIMNQNNVYPTITATYAMFVLSYPELGEDGEARFAAAEHMVRKAFSTPAYTTMPGGPFTVFRNQFYLNDADIESATCHTREDFETQDVPEVEIAITAIFLWFSYAMRVYGDFTDEFLYFIYAIADPCRGDKELKQQGANFLAEQVVKKPTLLKKLIAFFVGR